MRVRTRIRYKHDPAWSVVTPKEDGTLDVRFDAPQRAITPGQLTVFYQRDCVVGSAWIESTGG
jgi:tRNA-specific 2-thiouridylase